MTRMICLFAVLALGLGLLLPANAYTKKSNTKRASTTKAKTYKKSKSAKAKMHKKVKSSSGKKKSKPIRLTTLTSPHTTMSKKAWKRQKLWNVCNKKLQACYRNCKTQYVCQNAKTQKHNWIACSGCLDICKNMPCVRNW